MCCRKMSHIPQALVKRVIVLKSTIGRLYRILFMKSTNTGGTNNLCWLNLKWC